MAWYKLMQWKEKKQWLEIGENFSWVNFIGYICTDKFKKEKDKTQRA